MQVGVYSASLIAADWNGVIADAAAAVPRRPKREVRGSQSLLRSGAWTAHAAQNLRIDRDDRGGDPTIETIANPIFPIENENDEIISPALLLQPQFDVATAPFVYAVCKGVMHGEVMKPAGGKEGGYLTAWLAWRLWRDPQACAVFAGDDCLLCKDSGWTTATKMLPSTP